MKLFQLDRLNIAGREAVADSFNRLPDTPHKDGKFRLRRFSVVALRSTFWNATREMEIRPLTQRDFIQGEDLNSYQGGISREFEAIEEDILQSEGMKEICLAFQKINNLNDGQEVDIHQMRVITHDEEFGDATPVAPEGIHQDGFDCIAMVGIDRHNIEGGSLMAYNDKESDPVLTWELKNGEMLTLNDRELWHYASPIKRADKSFQGYGDWFILCARTS